MNIRNIINHIYPLPTHSLDTLVSLITEKEYPKHHLLFRENHKRHKSYFVKKGLARAYSCDDGKEITFCFIKEGDMIFTFPGFEKYTNIELLEDCILYEIDMRQLEALYFNDIYIANWGRKYAEHISVQAEKIFIARQFKTSSERYQELLRKFPGITQRVSLGIIASYLGTSQVNLSRIRAQTR